MVRNLNNSNSCKNKLVFLPVFSIFLWPLDKPLILMKSVLYLDVTHKVRIKYTAKPDKWEGGISFSLNSAKCVYLSSHYNIIFRPEGKWKARKWDLLTFFYISGDLAEAAKNIISLWRWIFEYLLSSLSLVVLHLPARDDCSAVITFSLGFWNFHALHLHKFNIEFETEY